MIPRMEQNSLLFLTTIGYSVLDLPSVKKGYLWAVTNA